MSLVGHYPPCQPAGVRRGAAPARGAEHPWIPSTPADRAKGIALSLGAAVSASKLRTSGVSTDSLRPVPGSAGSEGWSAEAGQNPTATHRRPFLDRPGGVGESPSRVGARRSHRWADDSAKAVQALDGITSVRSETGGTSRSRQSPPRLAPSLHGRPGLTGWYGWNPHDSRIRSTLTGRSGPLLQGQLTTRPGPESPRFPGKTINHDHAQSLRCPRVGNRRCRQEM